MSDTSVDKLQLTLVDSLKNKNWKEVFKI